MELNLFQQKNISINCLSDLTSNNNQFTLHDVLFRKFLTLADVSNYFYAKSIAFVTIAVFLCSATCIIPIPFADLSFYYSIHVSLVYQFYQFSVLKWMKLILK